MTITRAQLETELLSRSKGYMTAVGMDLTATGNNPDLNSPIGYAVRRSGGAVADPSTVTDADMSTFDATLFDQLADIAEERLLLNIKRRWAKVNISVGQVSESLGQLADQLDNDIDFISRANAAKYSTGGAILTAGVIDLNFTESPDA